MSFHIIYIPQVHDRSKQLKGYGSKQGCPAGHRIKSLDESGLLYGNGCSKHHDCFSCPLPECSFDLEKTRYAKNKNK